MRTFTFVLSLFFIFLIPWEGVMELPGIGKALPRISFVKLVGFAMAVFWITTGLITDRFRKPGPFQITVFLFVMWHVVSIFWSGDPGTTAAHLRTWIQLLALVFIVWDLYTSREALLAGLQAFILGEYVGIAMAVYNFFLGNVYYTHYQRFSSSEQNNPDGFGIIVALGIPVAWYLATSKSPFKMSSVLRLVNFAYIPAAFLGITLSGTRTALIAAIPGMAFGLASLTHLKSSARVAIFLVLTLVILALLPQVQSLRSFQRFGTIYAELTEGTLNNRTNNWREGLVSFTERPLLGVGSNMYRSVNSSNKLAHNSFLSVLVELGLIGFFLFGTALMIAFITAWGLPKPDKRFWITVLIVWAIGASSLTYEHRKATWLFLSFIAATPVLTTQRDNRVPFLRRDGSAGMLVQQAEVSHLSQRESI